MTRPDTQQPPDPGARFGDVAVALGLATPDQVRRAVERQEDLSRSGRPRQLAGILVEDRVLTPTGVLRVLAVQGKEIRRCVRCARQTTVPASLPPGEPRCGACGDRCERAVEVREVEDAPTLLSVDGAARAPASAAEALLGREVGGLILRSVLGEGGMGIVFRAEHALMDRVSAVKVLPAALTLDRERATRFLREAAVLARVQHGNVVAVRNVGEDAGLYFIEMELVHGGSLAARLRGVGSLEIGEAIPLMKGVAAGLGAAHAAGIVHRDVKPGNILIDPRNEPKLVDFGLARASDQSQSLTGTGAVMGTPDFMSPEQCRGEPATPASDVYAFGVTFYRALAGRLPFEGGSPLEVIHKHLRAEPVPPSALVPSLPRPWSELIERCLAKDPRERFADGDALLAALEAVERGERLVYTSRARRRRRRRLAAAAAAAGLLGLASWGAARGIEALRAPPEIPAGERLAAHVARGRNLLLAGSLWDARRELREALTLDARHGEARRLFSVVRARAAARDALDRGDPDAALRAAEGARADGPEIPGADALVAEAREALERGVAIASAVEALRAGDAGGARRALAELPAGATGAMGDGADRRRAEADLLARAGAAEEAGRFAEALALWEKLALSDPASPVAGAGRAVAFGLLDAAERSSRGESAEAFARAAAVAAAAPARASAARAREGYRRRLLEEARAASAVGDPARGLRLLDGLLAAAPGDPEAAALAAAWREAGEALARHLRDGEAALREGRSDDALRAFDLAERIRRTPEGSRGLRDARHRSLLALAEQARRRGEWVEAAGHLREAEAAAPEPSVVRTIAAAVRAEGADRLLDTARERLRAGALGEARAAIGKALALVPESRRARSLAEGADALAALPSGAALLPAGDYVLVPGAAPDGSHRVARIPVPLYVAVHETTNGEFLEFIRDAGYARAAVWDGEGFTRRALFLAADDRSPAPASWPGARFGEGLDRQPVTGVSWYEADAYSRWRGGRLPTAEEWEAAASVDPATGRSRLYPWGDDFSPGAAGFPREDSESLGIARVGSRPEDRSPIGCLDMAGNAAEWTSSPVEGRPGARRICGGTSASAVPDRDARPTARRFHGDPARLRIPIVGFRVVWEARPR